LPCRNVIFINDGLVTTHYIPLKGVFKMINSKGQGAMEYLMTYGWAILVVIIVGIVLWQSGVFGTGGGGTSGFDKIRVEDYALSASTNVFTVSYENAAGQTMSSVTVNYTYQNGTTAGDGSVYNSNWAPGKEYTDTINVGNPCGGIAGAGYSLDVGIAYTAESGLSHIENGTIRGQCE
jgi:uncharacterized protein (UPF0333 family)